MNARYKLLISILLTFCCIAAHTQLVDGKRNPNASSSFKEVQYSVGRCFGTFRLPVFFAKGLDAYRTASCYFMGIQWLSNPEWLMNNFRATLEYDARKLNFWNLCFYLKESLRIYGYAIWYAIPNGRSTI